MSLRQRKIFHIHPDDDDMKRTLVVCGYGYYYTIRLLQQRYMNNFLKGYIDNENDVEEKKKKGK